MNRHRRRLAATVAVLAAFAAAGCETSPSAAPTPTRAAIAPPMEPTPETGNANVVQSPWGPIWDAVPDALLLFAGAEAVEIDETVSAALDHPAQAASPADIASAYVTLLTAGGWRTVMNAPIEDGSIVVDAARDGTSCRAQVRATPLGGIVRITLLYGADCPRP